MRLYRVNDTKQHIMKKILFIIPAFALLLASCGGSTQQNNSGAGADSTSADGENTVSAPAYHYVEPKDSIARIIWNKLKEEDPTIKRVIAAAVKLNTVPQSKAENFTSKTFLDYKFECHSESENDYDPLDAFYKMQCYQMLDSSWIAVIDQRVVGSKVDQSDCGCKIRVVKYKDGTLSYPDYKSYFPKQIRTVELVNTIYRKGFLFDNLGLRFGMDACWPLQFTWNGSTFDCDSKEILNRINCYHYNINTYDNKIENLLLGHKYTYSPDKVFKSNDGTVLLKFDVTKGISQGEKCDVLAGYTVVDPSVGMVTEWAYDKEQELSYVSQEPIALGYPIKNVLNTKWSHERESDSSLTKETKDGKLYLTYKRSDSHDKRDYYLEFVAKDENSNIEGIRVYSEPFAVDIKEELGKCKDKSDKLKEIFNALDYKFVAPEFGEFNYVNCYGDRDGVDLNFWGKTNAYFQIMDVGGKTLVALSRDIFDDSGFSYKDSFWYYEDGKFTPTEFALPPTSYKGDLTQVRRTFHGVSLIYEVGYPDDETGDYFYEEFFWDDGKYVKQQ